MQGRARTYDEFQEKIATLFATENDANAEFVPRPTDVIISPFPKCGTTWLQQMVHSLRTDGDMDFEDIYDVVPWIDMKYLLGIDLDADQRAEPRAFKSHRPWTEIPKGCRYIVSFRNPKDAVVSHFRFMEGWLIEPGTVSIDEYVTRRFPDRTDRLDYWTHLESWMSQRNNPDVLLLTFEAMKADLETAVRRVADFIGVDGESAIATATEHSSFEFMSRHKAPFDEPALRLMSEEIAGIPPGSDSSKVRTGRVGDRRELAPETIAALDAVWRDIIEARLGYATYGDLQQDLLA